ncbi:FAD:protein FMN transferase [Yoonia sp. BS5-3]|uniref:FAD:protein FMN transferase n=1 Tax=Yoonia phaeophyticola TaxID=3137369 RepID=A0ABZ2V201_9RHOB
MSKTTTISRRTLLGMTLALAACKKRGQVIEIMGLSMGTTYNVAIVDHDDQFDKNEIRTAIDSALAGFNSKLSNWESDSEIARFNAAAAQMPVTMSDELSQVMQASAYVNAASEGRFDTTIGPLIELWGFGAPGAAEMPNPDAVARAIEMSGQANMLSLGAGQMAKRQDHAQVYLAGIGKGYGADYIGQVLERFGATDYMVEIGGDLYASGRNPDGMPWQIGIETPNAADRSVIDIVGLSGLGLATSGDYRNYFEVDGQRYSHLIDPATGYPVTHNTTSATVLDENAMLADAWSTAMLILGREKGLEIAEANGVAVQFIELDRAGGAPTYKTTLSPQFEALTA